MSLIPDNPPKPVRFTKKGIREALLLRLTEEEAEWLRSEMLETAAFLKNKLSDKSVATVGLYHAQDIARMLEEELEDLRGEEEEKP